MDIQAAKCVAQWKDSLERAVGFDSWGQVVEAVDEYHSLAKGIQQTLEGSTNQQVAFTDDQARFVGKIATVATLRASAAQDLTGDTGLLSVTDVKKVLRLLTDLPNTATPPPFPYQVTAVEITKRVGGSTSNARGGAAPPRMATVQDSDEEDELEEQTAGGGTLKPRKKFPGQTTLTMRIDKIKIKDPGHYIEPFFTVSFKDRDGKDVTAPMDTPPTNARTEFIHFNADVHMQIPFEQLPTDCAIFFEMKHYKPKKHKTSTKCYSFMEHDELKNGTFPLEVYSKPTDFRRKKYTLLTEKPHYLYVTIALSES